QLRVPQIRTTWDALGHAFSQSVSDLASLRMRAQGDLGKLPAAGMPWFMTVFGRDTIITCLQTLLFGPELARTALFALADRQATEDDPSRDAEPGKIVHEVRMGKAAKNWFDRYYGTVDATPLYLVLLSEVWQWTDDAALVRELKQPALAALRWIAEWGARGGGGGAAAALRRGVLGRGARRLLRARARPRQAPRRLADVEHGAPALVRDRPARARRAGRRPADGPAALVGLGRADDVERRRRV